MGYTYKRHPTVPYDYGAKLVPPLVLIDVPEEDWVECQAWVEVCEECVCPEHAQRILESTWPIEDRPDGEDYDATGAQVWLKPRIATFNGRRLQAFVWESAEEGEPNARKFWTVRVTCPI
jgi:hypothetical protein